MTPPRTSRQTVMAAGLDTLSGHLDGRSAARALDKVNAPPVPWWKVLGIWILKVLGVLGAIVSLFIPKLGYSAWVGVATFVFMLFLVFGQRLLDFATAVPKVVAAMFSAIGKGTPPSANPPVNDQ